MVNKDYLIFLLAISVLFNCLNLFSPSERNSSTPSSSTTPNSSPSASGSVAQGFSSFIPIKSYLGADSPNSLPKKKSRVPLPLRKMSTPLSQCTPGERYFVVPQELFQFFTTRLLPDELLHLALRADNLNRSLAAPSPLPLIAIMVASATRSVVAPSVKSLALFHYLLPSLPTTLDCGFRYVLLLGYDEGDAFFDTAQVRTARACLQRTHCLCCCGHEL